jgi:hypothetical protein
MKSVEYGFDYFSAIEFIRWRDPGIVLILELLQQKGGEAHLQRSWK